MPPDTVKDILNLYTSSEGFFNAFSHDDKDLHEIVSPRYCQILKSNGTDQRMNTMRTVMEQNGIRVLRYTDETYPKALREIDQYPPILFYQGDLQCLQHRIVAMVGSRAASYSGMKTARKLACDLSIAGVSVVSGMACGIDAASHRGCMDGGSPTVAVTGCGLDIVYPRENSGLKDDILSKGGLILTEYAPGEKPAGWHFPFRNRIITGLAHALIVIEAKIRSGTMTSVQHALNQGKDVFVYPGDPASPYSEGNHQLLREGALYFTTGEDILEDLGWLDNHEIIGQNSVCSGMTPLLSPEETVIFEILKPGRLSFEQIADRSGLSPAVLMSTLTMLQIKGTVEALPGKQYQLKAQA